MAVYILANSDWGDGFLHDITKPFPQPMLTYLRHHFDGLVQERCNSSALAMELRFFCTNPSILFSPRLSAFEIDLSFADYNYLDHWKFNPL